MFCSLKDNGLIPAMCIPKDAMIHPPHMSKCHLWTCSEKSMQIEKRIKDGFYPIPRLNRSKLSRHQTSVRRNLQDFYA